MSPARLAAPAARPQYRCCYNSYLSSASCIGIRFHDQLSPPLSINPYTRGIRSKLRREGREWIVLVLQMGDLCPDCCSCLRRCSYLWFYISNMCARCRHVIHYSFCHEIRLSILPLLYVSICHKFQMYYIVFSLVMLLDIKNIVLLNHNIIITQPKLRNLMIALTHS